MPKRLREIYGKSGTFAKKGKVTRLRRPRLYRPLQNTAAGVHTFVRQSEFFSCPINILRGFVTGGLTGETLNFVFSLDKVNMYVDTVLNGVAIPVPSSVEFSSLFDYYRIKKVEMTMFVLSDPAILDKTGLTLPVTQYTMPILMTTADTSLWNGQTGHVAMLQRNDMRQYNMSASGLPYGVKRYVYPKYQSSVYTGVSNAFSPASGWIKTNNVNVFYSGIQVGYPAVYLGTADTYDTMFSCSFKYTIECKKLQ